MKLNIEEHGEIGIATLAGDFNAESVDAFRRNMTERVEKGMRDFVLVLDDLEAIDSAGLESLLWLEDSAAEHLGQVRLVGVPETILTILRVTRLERHFERYRDVTDAVRSLR